MRPRLECCEIDSGLQRPKPPSKHTFCEPTCISLFAAIMPNHSLYPTHTQGERSASGYAVSTSHYTSHSEPPQGIGRYFELTNWDGGQALNHLPHLPALECPPSVGAQGSSSKHIDSQSLPLRRSSRHVRSSTRSQRVGRQFGDTEPHSDNPGEEDCTSSRGSLQSSPRAPAPAKEEEYERDEGVYCVCGRIFRGHAPRLAHWVRVSPLDCSRSS